MNRSPSVPARAFIDALDSNYVLQARTSGGSDTRFCGARLVWSIPDPGVVLHPLDACKIYDTRPGKGGREAPLASKESERLFVVRNSFKSLGGAAGNCGIPADAEGLLLSVNVLTSTAHGGIRVWTHGEAKPTSPSLIFNRGVRTSSAVPVVLSPQDKIMIHNSSNGETHVELVVLGWYSPPKS